MGVLVGTGVLLGVAVLLAVAVWLGVFVGGSGVSVGVCGVGVNVTSITANPQPDKSSSKNREKRQTRMSLVVCFMIIVLSPGWINLTKEAGAQGAGQDA